MNKIPFGVKFELAKDLTGQLINLVTNDVPKLIKDKMLYTVNLYMIRYDIQHVIGKFFKVPMEVHWDYEKEELSTALDATASNDCKSVRYYRGTPLIFHSDTTYNQKRKDDGKVVCFYLSTINSKRHIENLNRFIVKMIHMDEKVRFDFYKGKLQLMAHTNNGPIRKLCGRTFDDVFVKKEYKDRIIHALDKFVSSEAWYKKHNIPYHFGLMLYGLPGSGKSSLAQAIAHYLHGFLISIPGDRIFEIPSFCADGTIATDPKYINIILVEDVDCGLTHGDYKRRLGWIDDDESNDRDRKTGMAELLNTIDGLGAPTNTIYIFTTNHIEKLDPALIRPGRIDLKIDLGGVCRETFDQFTMKHYGRILDEDIEIPENTSFAELQTHVMEGLTLEELAETIRRNNK